jgi:hypothetical protein
MESTPMQISLQAAETQSMRASDDGRSKTETAMSAGRLGRQPTPADDARGPVTTRTAAGRGRQRDGNGGESTDDDVGPMMTTGRRLGRRARVGDGRAGGPTVTTALRVGDDDCWPTTRTNAQRRPPDDRRPPDSDDCGTTTTQDVTAV